MQNICALLANEDPLLPHNQVDVPHFSVTMTAYVDGVRNSIMGNYDPILTLSRPAGSLWHVNLFEVEQSFPHGNPVPGSEINADVNYLQCVDSVRHVPIGWCSVVHAILEDQMEAIEFGCPTETDYCNLGLSCPGDEDDA